MERRWLATAVRRSIVRLNLRMRPRAELDLSAEWAAFCAGNIPDLGEIPSYIDDDDGTIRAQTAGWHSAFKPAYAVFSIQRHQRAAAVDPVPTTADGVTWLVLVVFVIGPAAVVGRSAEVATSCGAVFGWPHGVGA